MMFMKSICTAAAITVTCALAAAPASAGTHCVRAGGSATAITKEVATLLAKESLYQSNMMAGRKGRGTPTVTCKYEGIVTTCRARQVSCK